MRFCFGWRFATAPPGAAERLGRGSAHRLSELGVPEPSVRVERVDALERTPGGKLQLVVANS